MARATPINFTNQGSALKALSAELGALPSNGIATRESWGGVMLTGKDPKVNVFDVKASYFTGATLLSITAPANSLAVINVRGTSATFTGIPDGTNGATGQLDTNFRRTRIKNDSVAMLIDWRPDRWEITGNFGGTRASGGKNPEYLLDFRTKQGFTAGANGRNTIVNWNSPASDPTKWLSNFTALGGENLSASDREDNGGRNFFGRQIGGIPLQSGFTLDKEIFGEANFKREVDMGPIKSLLFGGRYVAHENSNRTFSNAIFTNQNFTLGDLDFYVLDGDLYNGLGTSGNGTPYATLDRDGIIAALRKFGTTNVERGFSAGDYWLVREKIASGYLQANFQSGKLRGNVG
ncbi:MAG: choice-of-anchor A family protein, partial [Alphaproteobacteria bacterium]